MAPIFTTATRGSIVLSRLVLLLALLSAILMWWYAVRHPWVDLRLPLLSPWAAR
jgi:hypothetical protein